MLPAKQLTVQLLACGVTAAWSAALTWGCIKVADLLFGFRVDEEEEIAGDCLKPFRKVKTVLKTGANARKRVLSHMGFHRSRLESSISSRLEDPKLLILPFNEVARGNFGGL